MTDLVFAGVMLLAELDNGSEMPTPG